MDEIFYAYIIEHKQEHDYYLMRCEFKLFFNDNQHCPHLTSELYINKTLCYWYKILENVIRDIKDKGYNFIHIAEINFTT